MCFSSKKLSKEKKRKVGKISVEMAAIFMIVTLFAGCGNDSKESSSTTAKQPALLSQIASTVDSINVTSISVNKEGVLEQECCSLNAAPVGKNQSPEITWDEVDGASCYAVYMFDVDAENYIHLKIADYAGTSLSEGAIENESMYIGPYPASGTHHYQITVYALKEAPKLYDGAVNQKGDIKNIESSLDVVDDKEGNVLAVGVLPCTVTRGK